MSTLTKIKGYMNKTNKYEGPYLTQEDYQNILEALEIKDQDNNCIGMFCSNCNTGIHKYLYGLDRKECLVKYCPFCGNKLNWR